MGTGERRDIDVAVIGAGMAGFTAALQLKEKLPKAQIAILEKRAHPVPATAYKVGESIAEIATFYIKDEIGLGDYLEVEHLRKMGLRWFCSTEDNTDISRRIEFGIHRFSPLHNYHIDRGKIENHLATIASDRDIELRDSTHVTDVEFGADRHTVSFTRNGKSETLRPRWVIDASGRNALLRNKLGLGFDLPIESGSCWFRVPKNLMIDEWSDDPAWHAEVPSGTRWRSTISFVGRGYWIWVINLASGCASIGVVADPKYVPWDRIRRYEPLLDWLAEAEPQLAAHLPQSESGLLDFMKRRNFSHTCTRAFSRRRWALTGEAAVFLDPLYSTGHDTGAIGNTLLTDLIWRDFQGEGGTAFSERVRAYNRALLGYIQLALDVFPEQLSVYGQPQATGCKFTWDNAMYFSLILNLFRGGALLNPELMRSLRPVINENRRMNTFMQKQFREWGAGDKNIRGAGFPYTDDAVFEHLFTRPIEPMSHDELYDHVHMSVGRLRTMAGEMVDRMSEAAGETHTPEVPCSVPALPGAKVMRWSDYDRRSGRPADREPQPEDGWLLR